MSDAPERIYMDPDIRFPECEKKYGCDVEYVRADLVRELMVDIESLIMDSDGVVGLHLNGDVAPWEELLTGGRYEEWLVSLSILQEILYD